MFIQLTAAGQALIAAATGPIAITSFKLGSASGYIPQPSDTDIHGTTIYQGVPSVPFVIDANVVKYSAYLDYQLGPFTFGEIGFFVGTTLFALAASDTPITKTPVVVGTTTGNSVRIDAFLSIVDTNYQMWLDTAESNNQFRMAVLGAVDQLPASHLATPNAYVITGLDETQSAFIAYTDRSGLWNFDAYDYAFQQKATITAVDQQSVTIALSDFVPGMKPDYTGQVILEFATGVNFSFCRYVTGAIVGTSSVVLTLSSPMAQLPAVNDTFIVFGRKALSTTVPNLPIATHTNLGGVIVGQSLTVDSNGLIDVGPIDFPVTSVNGMRGDVEIKIGDITDAARVAATGDYNDLINKPPAVIPYTLPVATQQTLGGVKASPNNHVTVAADGTLDIGFSPVLTVNHKVPDANGDVEITLDTVGLINPTQVTNGSDVDTLTTTGIYFVVAADVSSLLNKPGTATGPAVLDVEVLNTSATSASSDLVQRWQGSDMLAWRARVSGTWGGWMVASTGSVPLATTTTPGIVQVGSGLNVSATGVLSLAPLPNTNTTFQGVFAFNTPTQITPAMADGTIQWFGTTGTLSLPSGTDLDTLRVGSSYWFYNQPSDGQSSVTIQAGTGDTILVGTTSATTQNSVVVPPGGTAYFVFRGPNLPSGSGFQWDVFGGSVNLPSGGSTGAFKSAVAFSTNTQLDASHANCALQWFGATGTLTLPVNAVANALAVGTSLWFYNQGTSGFLTIQPQSNDQMFLDNTLAPIGPLQIPPGGSAYLVLRGAAQGGSGGVEWDVFGGSAQADPNVGGMQSAINVTANTALTAFSLNRPICMVGTSAITVTLPSGSSVAAAFQGNVLPSSWFYNQGSGNMTVVASGSDILSAYGSSLVVPPGGSAFVVFRGLNTTAQPNEFEWDLVDGTVMNAAQGIFGTVFTLNANTVLGREHFNSAIEWFGANGTLTAPPSNISNQMRTGTSFWIYNQSPTGTVSFVPQSGDLLFLNTLASSVPQIDIPPGGSAFILLRGQQPNPPGVEYDVFGGTVKLSGQFLPYDMAGGIPGTIPASQVVLQLPLTRTVVLQAAFAGSVGFAGTAAAAAATFTVNRIVNGTATQIGTVNWASGARSATFTAASATVFNPGDVLQVVGPATPDTTLSNATFTLKGTASFA